MKPVSGQTLKIGIVQMSACSNKNQNIESAKEKVSQCASNGADIVILPEIFNSPYSSSQFPEYSEPRGGPSWEALSKMAIENSVYLIGGSIPESENGKVYNTSFVFDPSGKEISRHRKMHLFDIDIEGGQRFKESDSLTPGDDVTTFEITVPKNGTSNISKQKIIVGLCICFDFRFPELARLMVQRGATLLVVPAAFNMTTGPIHWELMFRQRAVDNQCYTVGVAPARDTNGVYVSYGNSIVVSPWGEVVFRADEKETTQVVEIDMNQVSEVRKQLPLLSSRRTDIYQLKASFDDPGDEFHDVYEINLNKNLNLFFTLAVEDEILEAFNLLVKVQSDLHNRKINQWTDEFHISEIRDLVLNHSLYAMKLNGKNGKIIGVCSLSGNAELSKDFMDLIKNEDVLYLSKVAVLPDFQRNGIGAEIVKCAIKRAKDRLGKNIALDCWNKNEKLKKFYSDIGFSFMGDIPEYDYFVSVFKYNIK